MGPTLEELADQLAQGITSSERLVEECLSRIDDPAGEGSTTFVSVAHGRARAAARGMDLLRKAGAAPTRYAGIPVSIKDLFDHAGEVSRAGSLVLRDAPAARQDATAVGRLKDAGFIIIGRTNMTEFAFSGIGINPHYGTPRNSYDRAHGRVPGGSSSGAAISITDQMAHGALGTDTGGSCRIPAAFNGVVGYKPTARRVPQEGVFPLSTTLDSIGPLARSVSCCAILDAVLAGKAPRAPRARSLSGLRVAIPRAYVMKDMDADVSEAFARTLGLLERSGVALQEVAFPEIDDIPAANAKGGFSAPESLATHRAHIAASANLYDARVLTRIERGREQSAADYIDLVRERARIIRIFEDRMMDYDCLAYPTTPIIAPPISSFDRDEDFVRLNMLVLRNPSIINFLDGCAISLPMTKPPLAPTGLTLACPGGADGGLFEIAAGVERILSNVA